MMEEIPTALLVALMFVTVLSMGIGNILATLANVVHTGMKSGSDRLQVSWIALLLLVHLNLFWHTLDLFNIEDWTFSGFVFALSGPILLFFATHTMMAEPSGSGEGTAGGTDTYDECSTRFFIIMALLQAWSVGTDPFLGRDFGVAAIFNVVAIALAVVLAFVPTRRVHILGAWAFWAVFLANAGLRGLGQIA